MCTVNLMCFAGYQVYYLRSHSATIPQILIATTASAATPMPRASVNVDAAVPDPPEEAADADAEADATFEPAAVSDMLVLLADARLMLVLDGPAVAAAELLLLISKLQP
jgi:hypothetical protein